MIKKQLIVLVLITLNTSQGLTFTAEKYINLMTNTALNVLLDVVPGAEELGVYAVYRNTWHNSEPFQDDAIRERFEKMGIKDLRITKRGENSNSQINPECIPQIPGIGISSWNRSSAVINCNQSGEEFLRNPDSKGLMGVMYHEAGHVVHNHLAKHALVSVFAKIGVWCAAYGAGVCGKELVNAMTPHLRGLDTIIHPGFLAVGISSFVFLQRTTFSLKSCLSRHFERQADQFAAMHITKDELQGYIDFFESARTELTRANEVSKTLCKGCKGAGLTACKVRSNMPSIPHNSSSSHPPLAERIALLKLILEQKP